MQICGRYFSQSEIDWIRHRMQERPEVTRMELSRMFCRHVGWHKADDGLKDMSCRVAMLRLERSGLIRLPAPRIKYAICHRKNALFYKTQRGANVGDLFMSLIHTCQLAGVNPLDYISCLLKNAQNLAKSPEQYMPWNFNQLQPQS